MLKEFLLYFFFILVTLFIRMVAIYNFENIKIRKRAIYRTYYKRLRYKQSLSYTHTRKKTFKRNKSVVFLLIVGSGM